MAGGDQNTQKSAASAGSSRPTQNLAIRAAGPLTYTAIHTTYNSLVRRGDGRGSLSSSSNEEKSNSEEPGEKDHYSTIKESFKYKLPDLPYGVSEGPTQRFHPVNKPTGQSTLRTSAPAAWIEEDIMAFIDTYFNKEFAAVKVPEPMPATEKSFVLKNEADVVRASTLYLIHPVNVALQAWYGTKGTILCNAENSTTNTAQTTAQDAKTTTDDAKTTTEGAETTTKDTKTSTEDAKTSTRTDIQWSVRSNEKDSSQEGPSEKVVAYLEFKRKHLIDPRQFHEAMVSESTSPAKILDEGKEIESDHTKFPGSSRYLVKQARNYRNNNSTEPVDDVCLFDWDTMFIFDFSNPDKKSDEKIVSLPFGMLHQERELPLPPVASNSAKKETDKKETTHKKGSPQETATQDTKNKEKPPTQEREETQEQESRPLKTFPDVTFRQLLLAFLIRAIRRNENRNSVKHTLLKPADNGSDDSRPLPHGGSGGNSGPGLGGNGGTLPSGQGGQGQASGLRRSPRVAAGGGGTVGQKGRDAGAGGQGRSGGGGAGSGHKKVGDPPNERPPQT